MLAKGLLCTWLNIDKELGEDTILKWVHELMPRIQSY